MGWTVSTFKLAADRFSILAAAVWLLGISALVMVPILASADAEVVLFWPSPMSVAWWVAVAVVTLQTAPVLLAPHVQVWAIVLVAAVALPLAAFVSWEALSITTVATIVTVFVAVLAADFSRVRLALLATILVTTLGYVIAGLPEAESNPTLIFLFALGQAAVVVALPAGVATVVRSRREARRAHESEQAALGRERDARVESALARQRTALARELHDIAAHHMSGIAVMASAVERQVDTSPDSAKDGAAAIRDQSRLVLEDLRRLVGLLREDDEVESAVYAISAIRDLVEKGPNGAELCVNTSDDGELATGIGPLGQLVGYRMVQEALVNAARHAPGASCLVEIDDRDHDALTLQVRNGPSSSMDSTIGSGLGLIGMQERAELVGATLEYGPTLEGGWEVHMRLPRDLGHAVRPRQQAGLAP